MQIFPSAGCYRHPFCVPPASQSLLHTHILLPPKWNIFKGRNSNDQKIHEKVLTITGHKGNANQNHTKIPPHSCISLKTPPTTNVGEDEGKRNPQTLLVGM
jgi:hypothetical protein